MLAGKAIKFLQKDCTYQEDRYRAMSTEEGTVHKNVSLKRAELDEVTFFCAVLDNMGYCLA